MDASLILILIAAACFVFEAFNAALGTFHPKWWALGIAFYLLAQVF